MFGAGERGCVISHICASKIIGWKSRRHLLPPYDTRPRVGLRQGPEMPAAPILRIGGNGARSQIGHDLGTVYLETVRIGKCDQRLRIEQPVDCGALWDFHLISGMRYDLAGR